MAFLCSTCELVGRPDAAVVLHAALAPYHGLLASNGAIGAGPTDVHLGAMSLLAGEQERAAAELMAAEEMCLRIDAPVWLESTRSLLALARSEEHTYELQSIMRISYAVFCLKKK